MIKSWKSKRLGCCLAKWRGRRTEEQVREDVAECRWKERDEADGLNSERLAPRGGHKD